MDPITTRRDLPPSDHAPLRRWFDRKRWKFGDAEWFASGEAQLAKGHLTDVRVVVLKGVEAEIARSDAAQANAAKELTALRRIIAKPPLWPAPKPKPAEPAVAAKAPTPTPEPPAAKIHVVPTRFEVPPPAPDLTKRELLIAFAIDTLTTVRGLAWTLAATTACFAGIVMGYENWVGIAIIDLFLTGLILLYPWLLPLIGLGQVFHVVKALAAEQPVNYNIWNFLVICGLLAIAWLGFRLIPALILRVVALAAMIGAFALVAKMVSPLFAAFSMPLATVSVGALLGAFYVAWILSAIYAAALPAVLESAFGLLGDLPPRGNTLTKRVTRLARVRRLAHKASALA